jgi:hypothetical protein
MANQFSKVTTFIIGIFDEMPLVNTISLRDDDVVDVEKENIYPLVSIRVISSPPPTQNLREFSYSIEVLNQRDDSKTATTSKLLTDTNYIDNINICDCIANNFVMEILKTHNDFNINIIEETISEFTPIQKDERNCLDGIKFEATFLIDQNAV